VKTFIILTLRFLAAGFGICGALIGSPLVMEGYWRFGVPCLVIGFGLIIIGAFQKDDYQKVAYWGRRFGRTLSRLLPAH
jgi:hypothetical protein